MTVHDGGWGSRPRRGTFDGSSVPRPAADALATPDDARYRPSAVIASGGMGRVEVVVDERLGREVARKTLRPELKGGANAVARFLREVRITARLDHPGIVPVFDAGTDPDGAPWYTMRLVRGRTLDDLLATSDLAARLALVDRFHAAVEAVAYAHASGVVHRDLKPSNILVGPFGETQVADWGIARELDATRDDLGPVATAAEGTRAGAVLGTHGWMSPEQERGEPAGPASDVYALGRVLRALLTGRSPPGDDVPDGLPGDLVAIAARATAPDPADRYPDAAALADDVAAWLAGRRVSAYAYPPVELARRLIRAWRAPLGVGAAAGLVLVSVLAYGWTVTSAERDRAVTAEEGMRELLLATQVADGVAALRAGELGAVATAAADALALRDDPGARGLVAALTAYGPHPRRLVDVPAPDCVRLALDPSGETLACLAEGAVSLWPSTGTAPLWTVPSTGVDVARPTSGGPVYTTSTTSIVTHEPRTGVPTVLMRSGAGRGLVHTAPSAALVDGLTLHRLGEPDLDCGGRPVQFYDAAWRDGVWLLPCSDWRLRLFGDGDRTVAVHADGLPGPTTAVFLDGGTVLVGTIDGDVVRVDLGSGELLGRARVDGPVRRLVPSPDGQLVAVAGERGTVRVLTLPGLAPVAALDEIAADVAWRADGTLVTAGARLRAWALDGPARWGVIGSDHGLDGVALRSDGLVTLHDGGGNVHAVAPDGAIVARLHWQDGVVKEGEHTADRFLAVGLHSVGVRAFDAATWAPLPPLGGWEYRDVAGLEGGVTVVAQWWPGVAHFAADGTEQVLLPDLPIAAVVGAEVGRRWLAFGDPNGLAVLDDTKERWRETDFRGRATLSGDGGVLWTVADGVVRRRRADDGAAEASFPAPDGLVSLGTSRDGALVALGLLDGTTRVHAADGTLLAILAGHDERVSEVRFAEDAVVTASWDGTARRWALGPLTAPVPELREALALRTGG